MDREAWHAAIHGVAKSWTWLSDWNELNWTELTQLIHVHPYPINIVSDSLYSVFILGNIETSIINSNQPIIQQHFLKLQSLIRDHTSPIYITHIQTHSCFSGPMTHCNKQANKLVSFATPKEQHALLHNNASPLHQIFKIPYRHAKEIINNCSTCRPLHLRPIAQDVNPRGLQLNKLWQMDITHCPELSPSSFPHVCINPNFFIWATPLWGEATWHLITHLLACFAIMGTPTFIKTYNGPAYTSRQFKKFLQFFFY